MKFLANKQDLVCTNTWLIAKQTLPLFALFQLNQKLNKSTCSISEYTEAVYSKLLKMT